MPGGSRRGQGAGGLPPGRALFPTGQAVGKCLCEGVPGIWPGPRSGRDAPQFGKPRGNMFLLALHRAGVAIVEGVEHARDAGFKF